MRSPDVVGVYTQMYFMSDHLPIEQQVDEWFEYLRERSVEFEKPPTLNEKYNIYHCFLRDPSGYLIEIQRFETKHKKKT
ncbi:VOC family protein [Nostoc sp.]|uniref:VOC family protein n=1 Tax=Nostoc sp. TaxID=1180 RepID=UPI002FFD37F1